MSDPMSFPGRRVSHSAGGTAEGTLKRHAGCPGTYKYQTSVPEALARLAWSVKPSALTGVGLSVGSPLSPWTIKDTKLFWQHEKQEVYF